MSETKIYDSYMHINFSAVCFPKPPSDVSLAILRPEWTMHYVFSNEFQRRTKALCHYNTISSIKLHGQFYMGLGLKFHHDVPKHGYF